jgi:hypothetical protein
VVAGEDCGLAVVATQRQERPDESDREKILLARDFAALERFSPADHIVTNPYNRLVDKAFVMERIRADVISYASFERQFDLFRVYGDTAVVVGSERSSRRRTPSARTLVRRFAGDSPRCGSGGTERGRWSPDTQATSPRQTETRAPAV